MADNAYLSRSGRVNEKVASGDVFELFKDQFQAEVMTEFEANRKIKPYVRFKTITKGRSASFPNLGKVDAQYVFAGQKLLGNQKIDRSETTIHLDPILVSDLKYPEIDVLMQEYDDRAEVKREMGRALARIEETQQMIVGCLAARTGGFVNGRAGGSVILAKDSKTNADKLAAAIYAARVAMKEKNVPEDELVCFLRPAQVAMLAQADKLSDHSRTGVADYAKGTVGTIAGINIIETNFLPSTNVTTAAGVGTTADGNASNKPYNAGTQNYDAYVGNFSQTVALVMQRGAIGTVVRKDVTVGCDWLPEELTYLLTARNLQGHGILDPRRAVEIQDGDSAILGNKVAKITTTYSFATPSGTSANSITSTVADPVPPTVNVTVNMPADDTSGTGGESGSGGETGSGTTGG